MKTLSRTSLAILIQTVASTIPLMPYKQPNFRSGLSIPWRSCIEDFFGGDSSERRAMHLVAWDVVCRSKRNGGLGIKQLHHTNIVALARLC